MTKQHKKVNKKQSDDQSELEKFEVDFEFNIPWNKAKYTVQLNPHKNR